MRWTVLCLVLLAGCASESFTSLPLNAPSQDEAIVHVIRPKGPASGMLPMRVYLDQEEAASVANNSYASFSVAEGEYEMRAAIKLIVPSEQRRRLEGGREYHFLYQIVYSDTQFHPEGVGLVETWLPAAQGRALMAAMDK